MRLHRVFGNVPGLKPMTMAPAFGEPVYEIIVQTDARGMMKTTITKYPLGQPPTQLQLLGMFLDCMNGQFQGMIQAASMIIDPNKGVPSNDVGQEKENHNGGGGDSGESDGT